MRKMPVSQQNTQPSPLVVEGCVFCCDHNICHAVNMLASIFILRRESKLWIEYKINDIKSFLPC